MPGSTLTEHSFLIPAPSPTPDPLGSLYASAQWEKAGKKPELAFIRQPLGLGTDVYVGGRSEDGLELVKVDANMKRK